MFSSFFVAMTYKFGFVFFVKFALIHNCSLTLCSLFYNLKLNLISAPGDVMSNVSHVSRASTCHVSVSAANLRSVSVDRDSGNYSLQAQSDPDKQSASEF